MKMLLDNQVGFTTGQYHSKLNVCDSHVCYLHQHAYTLQVPKTSDQCTYECERLPVAEDAMAA